MTDENTFNEALLLLRQLADIQNGPPLVQDEKQWEEIMSRVYIFLKEYEKLAKHNRRRISTPYEVNPQRYG